MDRQKVIDRLEILRFFNQRAGRELWANKPYYVQETQIANADAILADAIALLKEQEESIPVSWLKEKLEDHPELSYAVTDGIINVIDLWEGR